MDLDYADIVATPENYGFEWEFNPVSHQPAGTRIELSDDAPNVKVVDIEEFDKHFPGLCLACINGGQSMRVKNQSVTRRELQKDWKATTPYLQLEVVKSLAGARKGGGGGGTWYIVIDPDNGDEVSRHRDKDEYRAAMKAFMIDYAQR